MVFEIRVLYAQLIYLDLQMTTMLVSHSEKLNELKMLIDGYSMKINKGNTTRKVSAKTKISGKAINEIKEIS